MPWYPSPLRTLGIFKPETSRKHLSNPSQNSNVWGPNMACLNLHRTHFLFTCPLLHPNDVIKARRFACSSPGIDHCHLQQLLQSLNLGGRRHRRRWLWLRRLGEGRRWLGQRNKLSVQVTVKDFFKLIEGSREWVPWKRSERLWSTFIWWCHIRLGILSLVQWNLVKRFVTWKRMFVVWDLRIATFPHAPQFLG